MKNKYYTLITGASEGLGKSLAIECAKRGMNLLLVALPDNNLKKLANYLMQYYAVDVKYFEMDLSIEENCYQLFYQVQSGRLRLNMLINNAGIGDTVFFEERQAAYFSRLIKINVLATTLLTRLFVEILEKNTPAYILNTGSMAGFFTIARKQVYSGTKAFVYTFSRCLQKELKKSNIHVSVLCPGPLNTSVKLILMHKTQPLMNRLSVLEPEKVAPIAIDGLLHRKNVIVPGKLNRLFLILDKILPAFIKTIIHKKTTDKINPKAGLTAYCNSYVPEISSAA